MLKEGRLLNSTFEKGEQMDKQKRVYQILDHLMSSREVIEGGVARAREVYANLDTKVPPIGKVFRFELFRFLSQELGVDISNIDSKDELDNLLKEHKDYNFFCTELIQIEKRRIQDIKKNKNEMPKPKTAIKDMPGVRRSAQLKEWRDGRYGKTG